MPVSSCAREQVVDLKDNPKPQTGRSAHFSHKDFNLACVELYEMNALYIIGRSLDRNIDLLE